MGDTGMGYTSDMGLESWDGTRQDTWMALDWGTGTTSDWDIWVALDWISRVAQTWGWGGLRVPGGIYWPS